MSLIYYKLKNAIQQNSVTFDGSVIQIGDVKRLVAEKQGLGSEGYQEITLYDPNTGDEYDNDSKVVPRNTLVEVKRKPAAMFAPLTSQQVGGEAKPLETHTMSAVAVGHADGDTQNVTDTSLEDFAKGTASTWQREVRQGVLRGRGRGKGAVPAEYRCPRCEAFGAHWIQDCPTHGDPTYDKKRVRPPVGIPMTRLARSTEGGLVLPDGNTGTLIANEDAFAREVLGISSLDVMHQSSPGVQVTDDTKQPEMMPEKTKQQVMGFMPFSISAISSAAPRLAGMSIKTVEKRVDKTDGDLFDLLKYPELPQGPRDFLVKAYGGDTPLTRAEFEREQYRYTKDEMKRSHSKASRRRDRSRSRSESRHMHVSRKHERSRSRSRERRHKSRDRRRYESPNKSRSGRKRQDDHGNVSRHPDVECMPPKQKVDVTLSQVNTSSNKVKLEQDDVKNASNASVQRKHSPIRWSRPVAPRNGVSFAGQDEEPDLDYGESDDAPEEKSPSRENDMRIKGVHKSKNERHEKSGSHKTEREPRSRRDNGDQYSGKSRSRRH